MQNPMESHETDINSPPPSASDAALKALRVLRFPQFLPPAERDALLHAVCEHQHLFQSLSAPGVDNPGSMLLTLQGNDHDSPSSAPIRQAAECLSKRIVELLPTLFTALDVTPFAVPQIPLTLVNGLHGHTGLPHADDSGVRYQISLLYYFHRSPKIFRGGDLKFYESDPAAPAGHSTRAVARIDHTDNLLIAFPSHTFHGISDVRSDSDEFADGRFVAVGFLGPQ